MKFKKIKNTKTKLNNSLFVVGMDNYSILAQTTK